MLHLGGDFGKSKLMLETLGAPNHGTFRDVSVRLVEFLVNILSPLTNLYTIKYFKQFKIGGNRHLKTTP